MSRNLIPRESDSAKLGTSVNRWQEVVTKAITVGNSVTRCEEHTKEDGSTEIIIHEEIPQAIKLTGDIIVDEGSKYIIGEPTKKLKAVYADEVYISQHTLYVDGKPVLNSDQDTINFQASEDQGLAISTKGTGITKLSSQKGIEAVAKGENAHVDFTVTGDDNAAINFSAKKINMSGNLTVSGTANIENLTVTGTKTDITANNLNVTDNVIAINVGGNYNNETEKYAGIVIDRGQGKSYFNIAYYEDDKTLKIGTEDNLKTVATIEDLETHISSSVSQDVANLKTEIETNITTQISSIQTDILNLKADSMLVELENGDVTLKE